MGRCRICERSSKEIAREVGVFRSCILDQPDRTLRITIARLRQEAGVVQDP